MVRRLQSETRREVLVVVDERKATVHVPAGIRKISLDPGSRGLFLTPDVGWRCGDYSLYAAFDAAPEATQFWLIEPDVRIHSERPNEFFDGCEATISADFITAWFVAASKAWLWHRTMHPFEADINNCMLQLCRVSRNAVAYLYRKRVELTKSFEAQELEAESWPNDEAFVGATLQRGGLKVSTFRQHAPQFRTTNTFTFDKPTSLRWLDSQPYDNKIYHPVVTGEKFIERVGAYLNLPTSRLTAGETRQLPAGFQAQFVTEANLGNHSASRWLCR